MTSGVVCWKPTDDKPDDQDGWTRFDASRYLTEFDGFLVLKLPLRCRGAVDGLPVYGGIQRVTAGNLVRIWNANGSEVQFVIGQVNAHVQRGDNSQCQFCGLPITGEALRCSCGRVFCLSIRESYSECPLCGQPFEADTQPPGELL